MQPNCVENGNPTTRLTDRIAVLATDAMGHLKRRQGKKEPTAVGDEPSMPAPGQAEVSNGNGFFLSCRPAGRFFLSGCLK